jgi:tellurite resistance protein
MFKKQKYLGSIAHLPVNLFASVMGLAGLALAWRLANQFFLGAMIFLMCFHF